MKVLGVILAGGSGRRLGARNKALVRVGKQRMLDLVIQRLQPQCSAIAISTSGNQEWATDYPFKILQDPAGGSNGPLTGIVAGLDWAANRSETVDWLVSVPVDCPFLPANLVTKLTSIDHQIVVAESEGVIHHTIAVWRPALLKVAALQISRQELALGKLQEEVGFHIMNWETHGIDPFFNVNHSQDLHIANNYFIATRASLNQ
jgi:molybdopterin-guanine dinucleotide biosynthesis protein A